MKLKKGCYYKILKKDWITPFDQLLKGSELTGKYIGEYKKLFYKLEQPDGTVFRVYKENVEYVEEIN